MSEYKNIIGKGIRFLSSNLDNDQAEGQIWYNSTDQVFRNMLISEAWASGSPMIFNRAYIAGFGTQTAAVGCGGYNSPPATFETATEEYNGSGFSTGGALNTGRWGIRGAGSQTAGLAFFGIVPGSPNRSVATEEYNGTSWTNGGNLSEGRYQGAAAGTQTAGLAFGGGPATASPPVTTATEEYDGSSWTNGGALNTAIRDNASASAAPQTAAISFGGSNASSFSAQSEEYDGSSWTVVNSMNLARGVLGGSGIQTSALGYGGAGAPGNSIAKTEVYDGTNWSTSPADLATGRRYLAGAGSNSSTAVAFQGKSGTTNTVLTEEYNKSVNVITAAAWASGGNMSTAKYGAANWGIQTSAVSATGIPPANQSSNNTQEYNGSTWTSGTNYPSQRQSASGAGASESSGLAFGGAIPSNVQPSFTFHNDTQEYDGSSWTAGGNYPQTISSQGSSGTQTAAISVGGTNTAPGSPGLTTLAANYNGSSWTAIPSASNARGWGDGMTGTQTSALAVHSSPNVTEEYNGSSWTTGGTTNVNRSGIALSGTSNTDALGFGGNPAITSAESYDGTSFITSASLATGRDAMGGVGTGPAALGFGGTNNPPNFTATEEFTAETSALNIKTITTS